MSRLPPVRKNTGSLGGDVSMARKQELRDKYIAPLPGVDHGLHNQCRCGLTVYALWRGRWYCKNCVRWVRNMNPQPTPRRHDR